jgi:small conductance mechanosensitive channel
MNISPISADLLLAMRWSLFREDRFLGKVLDEWIADSQEFIHTKLPRLVVIAIIALVLSRLLRLITFHLTRLAEQRAAGPGRLGEVKTMAGVIRATGLAVIGLIAAFMSLDIIGFNLAPLLASAGIAGVAIGLAAQTIVKDMLNGFLILVEDQYSVGDTVRLAGVTGVVEALTLRHTTVRDADGTLYVIPNSQVTTVANLNSGYSMASIHVSVDFSANPDQVTKLLQQIAMEVRTSSEFGNVFLDDPQVLGIDAVKGSQMIFLVLFKTRANQQYAPVREFQRRVRLALEENHLLPGDPNRVFQLHVDAEAAGAARPFEEAPTPVYDPTTTKPQESNPFSGE